MKSTQRINCNGKGLIIKRQSASIPDYLPPFTVALYISGVLYMKNNKTYVQFYRKFSEWEWYKDVKIRAVFQHLVLMANWKNTKWQGIDLKRGERLTSIKHLAGENGLSEQNIRTILKKLKSTGELTIKSTSKYSIIYVVNYNKYQEANKQTNKQLTNNQQTTNKQLTTDNNYKKVNKVNKVNKSNNKVNIFKDNLFEILKIKTKQEKDINDLLKDFDNEKLLEIMENWKVYKKGSSKRNYCFSCNWSNFYEKVGIFSDIQDVNELIKKENGNNNRSMNDDLYRNEIHDNVIEYKISDYDRKQQEEEIKKRETERQIKKINEMKNKKDKIKEEIKSIKNQIKTTSNQLFENEKGTYKHDDGVPEHVYLSQIERELPELELNLEKKNKLLEKIELNLEKENKKTGCDIQSMEG